MGLLRYVYWGAINQTRIRRQGIGGLGTFRDAWGRKLVSVDAGQFGLMKSLGLNPDDNEDDILIDYSSSHLTIRYDFEGDHFEYGEERD